MQKITDRSNSNEDGDIHARVQAKDHNDCGESTRSRSPVQGSRQPAAPRNNHRNIHVIRKRPTESKPTARRTRWKPKKAIQKILEKTANLDQEIFLNNTTTTNYEGKTLSPKPTRASAAPRPTSVTRLVVQPRGTKARGSLRKAAKARHGRQSILIEYMYM